MSYNEAVFEWFPPDPLPWTPARAWRAHSWGALVFLAVVGAIQPIHARWFAELHTLAFCAAFGGVMFWSRRMERHSR